MRIAWFTHRYHPCVGDAENFAREMVRRFVRKGHQVDVYTSDADGRGHAVARPRKRAAGPTIADVDGARVYRFPMRSLPLQRHLQRWLNRTSHWPTRCRFAGGAPHVPGLHRVRASYDAVFGVGLNLSNFSFAAYCAAQASQAPLILAPFLHDEHSTTASPAGTSPPADDHRLRLLNQTDVIVVRTALEARTIAGWKIPRGRLLRLGTAVDHEDIAGQSPHPFRARLGISPRHTVVSHHAPHGLDASSVRVLHALRLVNTSRHVGDPVSLLLAGPVEPEFESLTRRTVGDLPGWARLLGPIGPETRGDFYAATDVLALPPAGEHHRVNVLEAWANSVPVVAEAHGGLAELVEHDQTGLLISPGDVHELANGISHLVRDRGAAARLGQAGRNHVHHRFTWDTLFTSLETRLDSLRVSLGYRNIAG